MQPNRQQKKQETLAIANKVFDFREALFAWAKASFLAFSFCLWKLVVGPYADNIRDDLRRTDVCQCLAGSREAASGFHM